MSLIALPLLLIVIALFLILTEASSGACPARNLFSFVLSAEENTSLVVVVPSMAKENCPSVLFVGKVVLFASVDIPPSLVF